MTTPKLRPKKAGRRPLYPWKSWEAAGSFFLTRKDYRGEPHGMAAQIRNKFSKKYRVSIGIAADKIAVRLERA